MASIEEIVHIKLHAGDDPGALAALEEGLDIRRKLVAQSPGDTDAQRNLSATLDNVGDLEFRAGDGSGALASLRESLDIRRRLVAANPGDVDAQRDLSESFGKVGKAKLQAGDRAGAFAASDEGLHVQRELAKRLPLEQQEQGRLAIALGNTAFAAILTGQYEKALSLSDEAVSSAPDEPALYTNRADALMLLGRTDEARTLYLARRGQRLTDGRLWEQAVTGDFDEFRKIGVVNPLMDEIQGAFAKSAPKAQ